MIRLSVSDLESFRYWKEREDQGLPELLAKLRHEEPPTPNMEAGKAFAKLFENSIEGSELEQASVDGWTFGFSRLTHSIAVPAVRELKAEVVFDTPSGPVTLVGKVDSIHGTEIHDQKLTERWDAERYLDSLQWRAYLVMFGGTAFVYDVFTGSYSGKFVEVHDYQAMTFYAYPAIRTDVERAVCELAAVVAEHMPPTRA